MNRRRVAYLTVRVVAALVFVLAATVLPPGVPAGLLVLAAGAAAVLSCVWANAGGPGEQAGARPQERWFESVRAPQGQWPPYDEPTTVPPPHATTPPSAAS